MRINSITRILVLSIIVFSLTTACSGLVRKGEKPAEDWSRSVVIGEDAVGSIGMAVPESGERVHLVWPYEDQTGRKLRLVQLDKDASIKAARDLTYPGHVRSPRLVTAGSANLHLFWVTRQPGESNWELWYQLFAVDGQPSSQPKMLTEKGTSVGHLEAHSDGDNGAIVIWDLGGNRGLKALRIDPIGDLIDGPHSIATSGNSPTFRVDPENQVHTAWLDNRRFFYMKLDVEDLSASEMVEIVDLGKWGTLNTSGDILQGPALGYADGWIYLFWSIVSLSDTEAGTGVVEYVAFPNGSPADLQPARIWALPAEDQPYRESKNSLALTQLSQPRHIADAADEFGERVQYISPIAGDWVDVSGAVSSYILSPSPMIGQQGDLAVALAVLQDRGSDTQLQIATTVFSEGYNLGYNFAGKTSYISDHPVLAADQSGDLFVAWREGSSGETIYFATTTLKAKAALDRLDTEDLVAAVPQVLTDALSSMAFAPFAALCWVFPGLLILGGWQLVQNENSLTRRSNYLPLGIALLLYYALKLVFVPTLTSYIPLSAWLYLPPSFEEPLRMGIPLLILIVAILTATWVCRRFNNSMLVFFLSLVAVDGLLTLVFYGVNLLGTY